MRVHARRALITSTAVVALTGGLVAAASAAPSSDRSDGGKTTAPATEHVAVGLIVQTDQAKPSTSQLSGIARAAEATPDDATRIDAGVVTIPFEEPLPLDEALDQAAVVEQVPGVTHVQPNLLLHAAAASPVQPDDTDFDQLVGIWDWRSSADFDARPKSWPTGGYSTQVPYLWRATQGSDSVRVAVVDTGITSHPDLDANVLPGYDFTSLDGDPLNRDDEAGWDDDASDPGDWVGAGECGFNEAVPSSSWHGTHVAGTVAAVGDNDTGVVGVAPGVKVQPIRALGSCGGTTADIATAIRWAAGASVPGVPANATPAQVINLSLGAGAQSCSSSDLIAQAIHEARVKGAVVVVAAGNENTVGIAYPANCSGAISVVAADEFGQATSYTNVGSKSHRADIAAPGGDLGSDLAEGDPVVWSNWQGIRSTVNEGTTTPAGPGYASYNGTSMATPHVAGGAALMSSLGYSRSDIEKALKYSVRSFPWHTTKSKTHPFVYSTVAEYNCRTSTKATSKQWDCGRGLLDLSRVPAIYGSTDIVGTVAVGQKVSTAMRGTGDTASYRWYRNGKAISGATKYYYKLTSKDRGRTITVKAWVSRSGFKSQSKTSAPVVEGVVAP